MGSRGVRSKRRPSSFAPWRERKRRKERERQSPCPRRRRGGGEEEEWRKGGGRGRGGENKKDNCLNNYLNRQQLSEGGEGRRREEGEEEDEAREIRGDGLMKRRNSSSPLFLSFPFPFPFYFPYVKIHKISYGEGVQGHSAQRSQEWDGERIQRKAPRLYRLEVIPFHSPSPSLLLLLFELSYIAYNKMMEFVDHYYTARTVMIRDRYFRSSIVLQFSPPLSSRPFSLSLAFSFLFSYPNQFDILCGCPSSRPPVLHLHIHHLFHHHLHIRIPFHLQPHLISFW